MTHALDQSARLAKARAEADEARGWALIEQPISTQITMFPLDDTRLIAAIPNHRAQELWGARLCFDLLDCGEDCLAINKVLGRFFTGLHASNEICLLIACQALVKIAGTVVPHLLAEIEERGTNYEERVKLAEARVTAWNDRVAEHDDELGSR
jgi:hypothetical protein